MSKEIPLAETMDVKGVLSAVQTVMGEELESAETKNRQRADKLSDRLKKIEDAQGILAEAVTGVMTNSVASVPTNGRTRAKQDVAPYIRGFFANVLRKPEISDADCDLVAHQEYSAAWPEFLRRGAHAMRGEFKAAMQVGSDPDGGFWVPGERVMKIFSRLFETSDLRQVCTVDVMNSDHREFPLDPNDLVTGGWVGETEARNETDTPELGMQTIWAREHFAQPKVTQKLLDTSDFNVEAWLDKKIVSKFSRDENLAFVSGDGIKNPMGFLAYPTSTVDDATRPWGTLQYIPVGAAGAFPIQSGSIAHDADALIDLSMSLKPAYLRNAKWAMRRSAAAVIRKLKDADGRWLWVDNLAEGGRPLLLGYPVLLWEDMPAIGANSLSIAFGDWSNYIIHDHRVGIRMLRDPFTEKGWVKFYTYKRVAGNVVAEGFDSIKLLKFSAS